MELSIITIPERVTLEGIDEFNLSAGKSLKIETSPSGEEILEVEVPAGKIWEVYISVTIDETDVE